MVVSTDFLTVPPKAGLPNENPQSETEATVQALIAEGRSPGSISSARSSLTVIEQAVLETSVLKVPEDEEQVSSAPMKAEVEEKDPSESDAKPSQPVLPKLEPPQGLPAASGLDSSVSEQQNEVSCSPLEAEEKELRVLNLIPPPVPVKSEPHRRRRYTTSGSVFSIPTQPDEKPRWTVIWWFISCCAFIILGPVISISLGLALHTPDFALQPTPSPIYTTTRTLDMIAILVSADPSSSTMVFDWAILGETDGSSCTETTLSSCIDVNIYFDSNLLIGNSGGYTLSNNIPQTPVFHYNATLGQVVDDRANSPFFRTNIKIFSLNGVHSSLVSYPFDTYDAEISIFAQDINGEPVGLHIAGTSGNSVGFTTTAKDLSTQLDSITGLGPKGNTRMIDISITLKRGTLVRTFCIIVVISIWLISLALLLLTFTSIVFGFKQRVEILIIPVATIFSFTQLRSSMPGAPSGFGDILDFVGLLPCLGILAFSAAIALGAFILTDPESKSDIMSWGVLRTELGRLMQLRRLRRRKNRRSKHPAESDFNC